MELNREQIIKALECCTKDDCDNCPNPFGNCYSNLAGYALSLIEELTEKVENYRNELGEVRFALAEANNDKKELTDENERLRDKLERTDRALIVMDKAHNKLFTESFKIKADTLNEFKNRLAQAIGTYTNESYVYVYAWFKLIDQIAKEMEEAAYE